MEIVAYSQADYRAYPSVVPESTVAAVQREEKSVTQIPAKDADKPDEDRGSGQQESSVPLSTSADVRAYTVSRPETKEEPSSDANVAEGSPTEATTATNASNPDEATDTESTGELTPEEEQQIADLKARDLEVRQHEQAHLAAAGSFASGGAQFQYQTGPDGKQYAIGGHVNIDTSKEGSPEATIAKAQVIQRAALAPADPSPQDVRIAAQASQMILEAQRELSVKESSDEDAPGGVSGSSASGGFGRLEDMGQALNSESF